MVNLRFHGESYNYLSVGDRDLLKRKWVLKLNELLRLMLEEGYNSVSHIFYLKKEKRREVGDFLDQVFNAELPFFSFCILVNGIK